MKKAFQQLGICLLVTAGLTLSSCSSQPKDSKIQKDFEDKAKTNPQLSTVSASVNDGVITLSGQCPDQACKTSAESAAREVKGVKSVVNNISVTETAPVVIADDTTLTNAVNNVVKNYKGVEATVQNGEVTLRGTLERSKLQQLMMDLNATNPKKVNNQLTLK